MSHKLKFFNNFYTVFNETDITKPYNSVEFNKNYIEKFNKSKHLSRVVSQHILTIVNCHNKYTNGVRDSEEYKTKMYSEIKILIRYLTEKCGISFIGINGYNEICLNRIKRILFSFVSQNHELIYRNIGGFDLKEKWSQIVFPEFIKIKSPKTITVSIPKSARSFTYNNDTSTNKIQEFNERNNIRITQSWFDDLYANNSQIKFYKQPSDTKYDKKTCDKVIKLSKNNQFGDDNSISNATIEFVDYIESNLTDYISFNGCSSLSIYSAVEKTRKRKRNE